MHPYVRPVLGAAAAGFLLLAPVGCGKAAEKISEKATEKAIEEASGGKANVDVGKDGKVKIETEDGSYVADGEGNVKIETEDGTYTAGTGEVPENWPDDVPLPKGLEVLTGGQTSADGVENVSIIGTTDQDPNDVIDDLLAALDGWEETADTNSSGNGAVNRSVQLTKGDRELFLAAYGAEGEETNLQLNHSAPA